MSRNLSDLLDQAREASRMKQEISREDPPLPPGYEQVTIPVPPQPDGDRFPVGYDLGRIEIGVIKRCPRCGGRPGKRNKDSGYFTDPDATRNRDGTYKRCRRCNGHGIVPNVGP